MVLEALSASGIGSWSPLSRLASALCASGTNRSSGNRLRRLHARWCSGLQWISTLGTKGILLNSPLCCHCTGAIIELDYWRFDSTLTLKQIFHTFTGMTWTRGRLKMCWSIPATIAQAGKARVLLWADQSCAPSWCSSKPLRGRVVQPLKPTRKTRGVVDEHSPKVVSGVLQAAQLIRVCPMPGTELMRWESPCQAW